MVNTLKKYLMDINEDAQRQYIDALSVFTALEAAEKNAAEVRGGMVWRTQNGGDYLIRTTPASAQKGLGVRSAKTEEIFRHFTERKNQSKIRLKELKEALERHQRMNKALRVGRAPDLLVNILNAVAQAGLREYFTVIGTHSLYAYEAEAGVRFMNYEAMSTKDIDLLWDVRKRLSFVAKMDGLGISFLSLLKKIDSTFELREDQSSTAVNSKGFEVDIIRREQKDDDPHPIRLTDEDDEFYAIQAKRAGFLLDGPKFSSVIVSTNGKMARMITIPPIVFAKFKRWMAEQENREAIKRRRDILQAEMVEQFAAEYLPLI